MQRSGVGQQELGHLRVEDLGMLGDAQEAAAHRAMAGPDLGPGAVLEALARLQQRLVADDRQPVDFLRLAVGVDDGPVAADQLRGDVAAVLDGDRVAERELVALGEGLVGERLDGHAAVEMRMCHRRILEAASAMLATAHSSGSTRSNGSPHATGATRPSPSWQPEQDLPRPLPAPTGAMRWRAAVPSPVRPPGSAWEAR